MEGVVSFHHVHVSVVCIKHRASHITHDSGQRLVVERTAVNLHACLPEPQVRQDMAVPA